MNNPWQDIDAKVYEEHMSDPSVMQLQTLNTVMKSQIEDYNPNSVIIYGVATGNGLEHVKNCKMVYAVDINNNYLQICQNKFEVYKNIVYIKNDIQHEQLSFPPAELALCNLFLEYVDEEICINKISKNINNQGILSLVFQVNPDKTFISKTKYTDYFTILNSIHHEIDENKILKIIDNVGLTIIKKINYPLPNNKLLCRIDFRKN